MAERLTGKVHVDSASVQGADSFIELCALTLGEMRVLLEKSNGEGKVSLPYSEIAPYITAWNWVGGDGKPLPVPSTDATIFDWLTPEEREFVSVAFFSGGRTKEDSKNSESG